MLVSSRYLPLIPVNFLTLLCYGMLHLIQIFSRDDPYEEKKPLSMRTSLTGSSKRSCEIKYPPLIAMIKSRYLVDYLLFKTVS